MRRITTTQITVETDEVVVLRLFGRRVTAWCATCAAEVPMLRAKCGAAGDDAREARRLAADRPHMAATSDGGLLICLNVASG